MIGYNNAGGCVILSQRYSGVDFQNALYKLPTVSVSENMIAEY